MTRSRTLKLRVRGDFAVFTRPEMKAERVSYPVMTPSAARGVVEAILWKPAIRWRIERIKVLAPIRWTALRRNEVNSRASVPSVSLLTNGGVPPLLLVEDDRAQRNTVALRDVDYVIDARFELTQRAGPEENVVKFSEMFQRRLSKGQHFHQPYLGCREFSAHVEPVDEQTPKPIDDTRDLGLMLWDMEFGEKSARPRFFRAKLDRGVLHVPDDPEATLAKEQT